MNINNIPTLPGVQLTLPPAFERLYDLAHNLWWVWDREARDMWAQIDPRRWHQTNQPISLLQGVEASTWGALEADGSFTDHYRSVLRRFDRYMSSETAWYDTESGGKLPGPVAYLCTEYGLDHKLPFYSGGLGVLAGDHLKTASDLGIPMVAVGVLHRRGYFRQAVDPDGDQQHYYPTTDLSRRPIVQVAHRTGKPLTVRLQFPGRDVTVAVWKLRVGRVPLLLLDTDIAENHPADRPITHLLYVRGREMRLAQELVLGVGAVKALAALDIAPAVWHVNEGHAAFSLLERLHDRVTAGETLDAAIADVKKRTLFTLHTPVPAGNEKFESGQVLRYAGYLFPRIESEQVGALGRAHDGDPNFDLGALAIRMSSFINGVSARHGEVAAQDWAHLGSVPIGSVTNGVHVPTWAGVSTARLYQDAIGRDWADELTSPVVWEKLRQLPDEDVWAAHMTQKQVLLKAARERIVNQMGRHGAGPDALREVERMLPEGPLTIGFARRFAAYKRATLILHDVPRLQAILTNPERPVQILFAGKAHPADNAGQDLIRRVVELSSWPEFRGHIFFLEDYDMQLGRLLTSGCDVWLNNPIPPMEASGTSGMKAGLNGALNLSVPDGWWAEGVRHGENGWRAGEQHPRSDGEDAGALYHLLEHDVVPLYYERNAQGIPERWVEMMKASMATVTQPFSSHRMLIDYATRAYLPLGSESA